MKIENFTLNASDLGKLLNVSARRVRQLAEEEVFPRRGRGQYPVVECVQAYLATLETTSEPGEIRKERVRLLQAQTERLERENAVARGELIEIELVGGEVEAAFARCRARLLAVPGNVAAVVIGETDPNVVQNQVMDEVSAALNELAYGAAETAKTE